jgi:hypothetical protein
MLWGAFSGSGVSELAVLEGKQKAENYIKTLSDNLEWPIMGIDLFLCKMGLQFIVPK